VQRELLEAPHLTLSLADVTGDREHDGLALHLGQARRDLHRHELTVTGATHALVADRALAQQHAHHAPQLTRLGRRVDGARRQAQELLTRVAEQPAGRIVDCDERGRLRVVVESVEVHRVRALLEQQPIPPLAHLELPAGEPGRLDGLLEPLALAGEVVHRESDEQADDDVAHGRGDVGTHVAGAGEQEGGAGDDHRPETGGDPSPHAGHVRAGHDHGHAEHLDHLEGDEENRHRISHHQRRDDGVHP